MEVVIQNLTTDAIQQAERGFRESAEGFRKFLKDAARLEEDLYTDQGSVQEFKRYVQKWFDIFSLSLLNPRVFVESLMQGKTFKEALDACETLTEISSLCQQWLNQVSTMTLESRANQLQKRARSMVLMDAEAQPTGSQEPLASYAQHFFGTSEGSEISARILDPNRCQG